MIESLHKFRTIELCPGDLVRPWSTHPLCLIVSVENVLLPSGIVQLTLLNGPRIERFEFGRWETFNNGDYVRVQG